MKRIIILTVFVLSLCLPMHVLNADSKLPAPSPGQTISLDFQDANLKDILKAFSIQSGLNFIASEAVQERKVTLFLDNVPLERAMDKLFKANNLSYELDKDANIFIVKDWGKMEIETVTKVFYLKYATVSSSSLKEEMNNQLKEATISFTTGSTSSTTSTSSTSTSDSESGTGGKWGVESNAGITQSIKKLISSAGSVIEDFRTNSLIVTDTPNRMAVISQVIASLDVAVPQVLLEVEMLDVSKNVVDKLGFNYGQSPFTAVLTGASAATGFPFNSWTKFMNPGTGTLAINAGTNSYSVTLDYLRTQTDTKFLARPRILTLNNEPAEIRIATNESIGVTTTTEASTSTTSASPERTETGVILRVAPQINTETGEITMFIFPKVAEAVQGSALTSGGETFQFRDPEERSSKSVVRVKDGETVVVGGLIRNEKTEVITKLPILGDLPIIGALFRHKGGNNDKDKTRELIIFITPHIIKDKEIKLAQTEKNNFPEREQGTVSGTDRSLAINRTLKDFEKK